jgi:hypothetical protein
MLGHFGMSPQNSFGTATSAFVYIPIESESLTTEIEQLIQTGMTARFDEPDSQAGLITIAGDITFQPDEILMGHMLRGVCGQSSGTLVGSVTTHEFLPTQADFTPSCALPPYTIEMHRDDASSSWVFQDAIVNNLSVTWTAGQITGATASIIARVSSLQAKTTPTFDDFTPYNWSQTSLSLGGAGNDTFEEGTLTISNAVEGKALLNGSRNVAKMKRTGYRTATFDGTVCFEDTAEYDEFFNQTERVLIISTIGASLTTSQNNELLFNIPKFRYTSYPVGQADAGLITVGFTGACKYDTTSSYEVLPTMVNTQTSY